MILEGFQEWDPSTEGVDFRKVSTKATTKAVIFSFDEQNPDECPQYATKYMRQIFESVSGNVKVYENKNARYDVFLDELEDGKNWHFFIFYAFGHGGKKCFSLWNEETQKRRYVMADAIWERLGDAKNRFIGIFDNCYSGSQLDVHEDENGILFRAVRDTTVAEELMQKFLQSDMLFKSHEGQRRPMFQLLASTQEDHIGVYSPTSSTQFTNAMNSAWKKYGNDRYDVFWEYVVQKGRSGSNPESKQYVLPQRMEYGEKFSTNFAMR